MSRESNPDLPDYTSGALPRKLSKFFHHKFISLKKKDFIALLASLRIILLI